MSALISGMPPISVPSIHAAAGEAAATPPPAVALSIVIVGWNTCALLHDCLSSVQQGIIGIGSEVIYVDNGSIDNSVSMVEHDFPFVTIIRNRTNAGFVSANNQAIIKANGRYILLLNSDTVIQNDTLSKMLVFAEKHPDGASFGCRVLNSDGSLQRSCFMGPSLLNMLLFATYLYKLFPDSHFFGRQFMTWWDGDDSREVETISGCCALIRREAVDDVGLMNPAYFFYGDDLDWCFRFRKNGWKVFYTPETSITHHGGRSTLHMKRTFRLQLYGTNLLFFYLNGNWLRLFMGRLLTSAFFILRFPYWLLRSVFSTKGSKESLEEAEICLEGFRLSLFDWKKMLIHLPEPTTSVQ